MLADFFLAAVPLLVVVDPLASLGLYLSLTSGHDRVGRYKVALRATVFAGIVLLVFGIAGRRLLHFMGIELYSLQVAGGLLLVLIGINMLREGEEVPVRAIERAEEATPRHDPSLVPLGLPMLAGPGAITQSMVQATKFDAWVGVAAIVAVMATSLLLLVAAARASHVLGENARRVITRIMGLLTVAFAAQYVLDGIDGWLGRVP